MKLCVVLCVIWASLVSVSQRSRRSHPFLESLSGYWWDNNWVWMPPWGMEKITEDGREQLRAIGFNL